MMSISSQRSQQYIEFIRTTAKYPGALTRSNEELSYLALGLGNEFGEYLEKTMHVDTCLTEIIKSELGDTAYYLFRLYDCYQLALPTPSLVRGVYFNVCDFVVPCAGIQGLAKKVLRDGIDLHSEGSIFREKLRNYLDRCYYSLRLCASNHNIPFGEVLRANQEKLEGRVERGTLLGSGDNR